MHLAGFAPAFSLSLCDSECSRKPPMPIASVDIVRRLSEHNRIKGKYTDKGIPWELVYKESYADKVSAENREIEIKRKKSRKYIESLLLSAT